MSFSKNSEVIMKYFLNDFDKYSKKSHQKIKRAWIKFLNNFGGI